MTASALASEAPLSQRFRTLFDGEFIYVCRALRRLGVSEGDLPDVAQEVFVAVHRQLGECDSLRPMRPWLFGFAFRFAANYRRLKVHRMETLNDDMATPDGSSTDARVVARDTVLRALSTLDFDQRAVVVMHDLEGFSVPEIASQTATPLNTVYSRLRLGREHFRDAVASSSGSLR